MAIDLSDPTIIAAIISIAGAFIVGVLGALYVPLFNEWMQTGIKKRSSERGSIENSYTRYENAMWQIKRYNTKQWRSWIF